LNDTLNHFKGISEHYDGGKVVHFGGKTENSFKDKQKIFVDNHLMGKKN
jgi:hypothetical protein